MEDPRSVTHTTRSVIIGGLRRCKLTDNHSINLQHTSCTYVCQIRQLVESGILLGTVLEGTLCEDNDAMGIIAAVSNCLPFAYFNCHVCFC